jgi:hypothetical protein
MTVIWQCDYCGLEITGRHWAKVTATGRKPGPLLEEKVGGLVGHFHTDRRAEQLVDYEDSCYRRAVDAMYLALDAAPTLEHIPVASGQAISAKRRKHRRID